MSVILVCPADRAAALAREHRPSHVLGLASPQATLGLSTRRHAEERPEAASRSTHVGGECVLRDAASRLLSMTPLGEAVGASHREVALVFHDIAEPRPNLLAPTAQDVAAILAFGRSWDGSRPLLVHCTLGISRSTAAALALAVDRWPQVAEIDLACQLRAAAPCATPNPLMVALADAALGRHGRLIAAVATIGRGAEYVPQAGFALARG